MTLRHLSLSLILSGALVLSCSDDNGTKPADSGPEASADDGATDIVVKQDQGADAPDTKPIIDRLIPADGFAGGGSTGSIPVVVTGKNFAAGATAYIDGGSAPGGIITQVTVASSVSLSFQMPKDPYGAPSYDTPRKVSVAVLVNGKMSNSVDFQYTISEPMTAAFNGSVLTPSMEAFSDFPSRPIEGQVYAEGVTDTTTGAAASIMAQIGVGLRGTDPSQDPGWRWFDATFDRDAAESDVYVGRVTPPLSKPYAVAYRFSQDNGQRWVYADTDVSDLIYVAAQEATLTASDAPPGYCQSSADCKLDIWLVTCKESPSPTDWQANRCVMCLQDQDCADNPEALGPNCDANNLCGCSADADCATNPNGALCLGYCGCQAPENCMHPEECFKTSEELTLCMPPQP